MRRRAVIVHPEAMKKLEYWYPGAKEVSVEILPTKDGVQGRLILRGKLTGAKVWHPLKKDK